MSRVLTPLRATPTRNVFTDYGPVPPGHKWELVDFCCTAGFGPQFSWVTYIWDGFVQWPIDEIVCPPAGTNQHRQYAGVVLKAGEYLRVFPITAAGTANFQFNASYIDVSPV